MKTQAWPLKFPPRILLRGLVLLAILSIGWNVASAQSAAELSTAKPQAATSGASLPTATSLDPPDSLGSSPTTPTFRVEKLSVTGGSELLTIFGRVDGLRHSNSPEVPLVSVLRDTLGDNNPENDRLRYIWVLTSARPTLLQHAAAFIPFFYWRPDLGKNMNRKPAAVLDMGNTSKVVWNSLAQAAVQAAAIDSNGALIRSTTRRYRANLADQRQVNLMEGLAVISRLEQ